MVVYGYLLLSNLDLASANSTYITEVLFKMSNVRDCLFFVRVLLPSVGQKLHLQIWFF